MSASFRVTEMELDPTQMKFAMLDPEEIEQIAQHYGQPEFRHHELEADEYMHAYRWRDDSDRRAEVVFAIQQPDGKILLHTKHWYQPSFYRLFSGGIGWYEPVANALHREIQEETGLTVTVERFLGVLRYTFHYGPGVAEFASYVFFVRGHGGQPVCTDQWEVAGYLSVRPQQMRQVSAVLRTLDGKRSCWGQWRAFSHDLVCDYLE